MVLLTWRIFKLVKVDLFLKINRLEYDSDKHAGLSLLGGQDISYEV